MSHDENTEPTPTIDDHIEIALSAPGGGEALGHVWYPSGCLMQVTMEHAPTDDLLGYATVVGGSVALVRAATGRLPVWALLTVPSRLRGADGHVSVEDALVVLDESAAARRIRVYRVGVDNDPGRPFVELPVAPELPSLFRLGPTAPYSIRRRVEAIAKVARRGTRRQRR